MRRFFMKSLSGIVPGLLLGLVFCPTFCPAADFDLAGANQTLTTLSGYSGVTNSATTDAVLTLNLASGTETFSGTFQKGGANSLLTKTGAGTLKITGSTNWTSRGKIIVSAGTLELALSEAAGGITHSSIDVESGGTLQLDGRNPLGNGPDPAITLNVSGKLVLASTFTNQNSYQKLTDITLNLNGGSVSETQLNGSTYRASFFPEWQTITSTGTSEIAVPMSVRNGNTLTLNVTSGTLNVSGQIGEKFNSSLNYTNGTLKKTGAGTLILSNSGNLFTGKTTVSAGSLKCGASSVLETSSGLDLTGSLDLAGTTQTIQNVFGTGSISNSSSDAAALTVNLTADGNFSGPITGKIALTKTGSGTWNVDLKTAQNYWNGLTAVRVEGGKLSLSRGTDTGTRPLTAPITVTGSGTTLELATYNVFGYDGNAMTLNVENGATLSVIGNGGDGRHGQQLRGITTSLSNGHITSAGSDYYLFTSSGITIHSNGTSSISAPFQMRDTGVTFNVTDGSLTASGRFVAYTNGSGIQKTGAGALILTNSTNTTNGLLNAQTGALILDGAKWSGNVTAASGTSFSAENASSVTGTLTLNGEYLVDLADLASQNAANLNANALTLGSSASLRVVYGDQPLNEISNLGEILFGLGDVNLMTVAQNSSAAYSALSDLLALDPIASSYLIAGTSGAFTLSANHNALPEPGTCSLLLLALTGLLLLRRKRA